MRTTALVAAIIAGFIPSAITAPAEAMTSMMVAKFGADLTASNHYGSPKAPWQSGSKPGWYYGGHPDKHPNVPCLTPDNCKFLSQYPGTIHCPPTYPPPPPHHNPPPPPPYHTPPHHSPPPPPPPPHHSSPPPPPHHSPPPPPPHHSPPPPPPHHSPPPPPPHHTTTKPTHSTPPHTTTPPPHTTQPPPPPSDGYTPTFYNITAAVQADDYMTFGLVDSIADCKTMCNSVQGCAFVNTYHDVNGKDGSTELTCALFGKCHGPEDADNRGGQSQPDGSIDFITNSDGYCKTS